MNEKRKVAVIGAGTAGVIQVCMMSYTLDERDYDIDWIYDPEMPIFGIGEATTPHLPEIFGDAGFSQCSLIEELRGTIKFGVKFYGWGKTHEAFWHEFKPPTYGVHLDTKALSDYALKYMEQSRFGNVKVVPEKVEKIYSWPDKCEINGRFYDFVIDCGGNDSLLDSIEYSDKKVFTTVNSALVYRKNTPGHWNYSVHYAHKNGWMFGLPLRDRQTWGYTFNRNFTTLEEAKEDFQAILPNEDLSSARHVEWNSRFSTYLINDNGNYAKNGNALAFIEPLQSISGLHYSGVANLLCFYLNERMTKKQVNEAYADDCKNWSTTVAYHYQFGSMYDSPFWNDVQERAREWIDAHKCSEDMIARVAELSPSSLERLSIGTMGIDDIEQLSYGLGAETANAFSPFRFGEMTSGSLYNGGSAADLSMYLQSK